MWVAELCFKVIADTDYSRAEAALRRYLEALIFNGQVLGREWPTHFAQDSFYTRVVLPAADALHPSQHSERGRLALAQLGDAGLGYPQLAMLGHDLMSNHSDPCHDEGVEPTAYIWYSRFAQMNSVLYCADHFAPVPLYRAAVRTTNDYEDVIRWQLQYQALDEIQMQETSMLPSTEQALQDVNSRLNHAGRQLAQECATALKRPVYYALYSGSSDDCQREVSKTCPSCGGHWKLDEPWHGLFDFRCERCSLVSNIAWQCQG